MVTTPAATAAVAIQPPILSGSPIVSSPMMRRWVASHIMIESHQLVRPITLALRVDR